MFNLDQTIKDRHSTRKFFSQPVPRTLLNEALALEVRSKTEIFRQY
jgi:nitroreductase